MELTEPPPNPPSFAAGLDGEPAPHRHVRVHKMRRADDLFAKCERDGEETVRKSLADKTYCTHSEIPIIKEWLRRKDEERALSLSSIRDEREERTLSIAAEANRIASSALAETRAEARLSRRSRWKDRIIPIIAIIIAAIAAREDITWLISWFLDKFF